MRILVTILNCMTLVLCANSVFAQDIGFIPVNGGKLHYQEFGKRDNYPIIVVHGGPGLDSTYLLPQMATLGNKNFVTFYDQRGSGKSLGFALNEKNINVPTFVADLNAVRKHLKASKVIILAHSWGAILGMCYAIEHPEHVAALILVSGAPSSSQGFEIFIQEYSQRTKHLQSEFTKITESKAFLAGEPKVVEDYFRKVFSVYFYKPTDVSKLTIKFTQQSALDGRKVGDILGATYLSNYNLTAQLQQLQVPVLILHGEQDIVPISTAIQTHEAIPHSKMVSFKECDHFPYIEKPALFFDEINTFISNVKSKKISDQLH